MEKGKKGLEISELILWIIAVISLALIIVAIIVFKEGGASAIKKILDIFLGRA